MRAGGNVDYVRVGSLAELGDALDRDGATLIAGGTDLMVKMRAGSARPRLLVDISRVDELREVSMHPSGLTIGSAALVAEVLASPPVSTNYPLLATVLRSLGSTQIRNRATLGGNLANASPAADSPLALLAYDARVTLAGAGTERALPLHAFFLGPGRTALRRGEYIRSIDVPTPRTDWDVFFHKVGRRRALTIAITSVAGLIALRGRAVVDVRVTAGSVAPTPIRLRAVEDLVRGRELDEEQIAAAHAAALREVSPIDDVRATALYRRTVTADLVARFLREASESTPTSP
jgi:CO/xanthine dehydrogenase FAD-binding subunit